MDIAKSSRARRRVGRARLGRRRVLNGSFDVDVDAHRDRATKLLRRDSVSVDSIRGDNGKSSHFDNVCFESAFLSL